LRANLLADVPGQLGKSEDMSAVGERTRGILWCPLPIGDFWIFCSARDCFRNNSNDRRLVSDAR